MKSLITAKHTLAVLAISILSGCASSLKYQTDFQSVRVDRKDHQTTNSVYEDALVKIKAEHAEDMKIWVTNKSKDKIKIVWDDSVFVDPLGTSHKIIHSGVRYIAKDEAEPPTVIVPGAVYDDVLSNVDNIYFVDSVGWQDLGLLQSSFAPIHGDPKKIADKFVGKPMTLLIVIEDSTGKRRDYYLKFLVKGYQKT